MSESLGLLVKKQISWFLLQTFSIRIAEGAMRISILSRFPMWVLSMVTGKLELCGKAIPLGAVVPKGSLNGTDSAQEKALAWTGTCI